MIAHIFIADFHHLSIPLIRSITENFPMYKHSFILFGKCDKSVQLKYSQLFQEKMYKDYIFLNGICELYCFVKKNSRTNYIMHGTKYQIMLCFTMIQKPLNWICWGGSSYIRNTFISKLSAPIKSLFYKKCNTIVTLMTNDSYTLKRDFNVNSMVLPYYGTRKLRLKEIYSDLVNKNLREKKELPIKVLLGNSTHNLDGYLELLPLLCRFNKYIEIHCMMQYPKISNINEFAIQCKQLFGKTVIMDVDMLDEREYIDYINSYDIYLCAAENQSGLGAISTCLLLGKKIYLKGKNYDWITSRNNIVYHTNELKSISAEDFIRQLPSDIIESNVNNQYNGMEELKIKWINYFDVVENNV